MALLIHQTLLMEKLMQNHLCRYCDIQLIEKDENGKLRFGKHLKGCPALLVPKTEGPARKAAKSRLVCGDLCVAPDSTITDLGNGLSHCSKCKSSAVDLAKQARSYQMYNQGNKKPIMDIIHPAPKKSLPDFKRLYLDLLQKYTVVIEELEQYKKGKS